MDLFELLDIEQGGARLQKTTQQLLDSNKNTSRFGLALSEEEAGALALRGEELLETAGRVEFGEGILSRLAFAFCDSPYIAPKDWAQTLGNLLRCFYHFKSETELPDDELLARMKAHFDGDCAGSLEYMEAKLLEWSENLRKGIPEEENSEEKGIDEE